jgi:cytoskeletal protein CcmA (bactofilin family)
MSIFRRDTDEHPLDTPHSPQRSASAPAPHRRDNSATRLAKGIKVTGRIEGSCDLAVEGHFEGQIELERDVSVGAEGRIKGDINARSVRIGGSVQGNVRGTEKVEILATGRLEGDLAAPRVMLAEGAFFRGQVEMTGSQGRSSKPTSPRPKPS